MTISVRDLAIGEMIALTEQWTGALRTIFIEIPEIRELLAVVEARHADLVGASTVNAAAAALIKQLEQRADDLDERHDHLARAIYYLFIAWIELQLSLGPAGVEEAESAERAQAALYPGKLSIVQAPYIAEAGNAAQMVKLATEQFKALLQSIYLKSDVTAYDLIMTLGGIGSDLGEAERKKVEAEAAAGQSTLSASEVRRRMRAWADSVEAVLGVLGLSKAPADKIEALRRPVVEAATKASERRRARQAREKAAAATPKAPTEGKPAEG